MAEPQFQARPLRLATVWVPKIVTVDPPRLTPHTEWRLDVKIVPATAIRVAVVLRHEALSRWGLLADEERQEVGVRAVFAPAQWRESDRVRIGFEWHALVVDDHEMKLDPRNVVDVVAPEESTTGVLVKVAQIPGHNVSLAVMAFDYTDVEARRGGKWRVRPTLAAALPPSLSGFTSGRQSGGSGSAGE